MAEPVPKIKGRMNILRQTGHISNQTWDAGREAGRGDAHKIRIYNYSWQIPPPDRVVENMIRADFYGIHTIGNYSVDRGMLTALVDRWRDETHSFHFVGGELGISLQDVEIMLGLRVDGLAVTRSERNDNRASRLDMIESLLGLRPADNQVDTNCLSVRLDWMLHTFGELPPNPSKERLLYQSRAAMLLLLGAHVFSDKNSDQIPLWPLPFLEDFDTCAEYSWGSALLAWLEANLCKLVRGKSTGVSGAVMFLDMWAMTRLLLVRPCEELSEDIEPPEGLPRFPLGYIWKIWRLTNDKQYVYGHNVVHIRDQFDHMSHEHIVWQPYGNLDDYPEYCTRGRAMWHCSVPLICNEKIEFHAADKFMRQLGFVHVVPTYIWKPKQGHGKFRRYGIGQKHDWPALFAEFIIVWNDRHNRIINGEFGTGTSPDYMRWYRERTHIFINPPELGLPSHGFREHTGLFNKMKAILRRNFKSFKRLKSKTDVDLLRAEFAEMGMNAYGSGDEQSDEEDDDDDDGDDDQGYDPRTYARASSYRRTDRGRAEGESSGGGRGRGRRTSGSRCPTTDQGGSSNGHRRHSSFAGSDYVHDDVPFDYHRQSFGSYKHQPSQHSTDSWARGLTLTSHERAPHPESQYRDTRRPELNEIDESTEPSPDRLPSAEKMLPMSNFKGFSRAK